jgi:hypothetical protein
MASKSQGENSIPQSEARQLLGRSQAARRVICDEDHTAIPARTP